MGGSETNAECGRWSLLGSRDRGGSSTSGRDRLRAGADRDAFGGGGDAVGEANLPPAFALVHAQDNAGGARRMVGGCIEQQKIWPQLRDRDTVPAKQQTDPDIGGMTAVTAEHGSHG
jgi:hypothetical protein